jgi:SAM-dependent methyltransferase
MNNKIIEGVADYYSKKVNQYGISALGVDWNSKESQYVRFDQLCKVIPPKNSFSLLDYGCGYGELLNYLMKEMDCIPFNYVGYDISINMIDLAKTSFGHLGNATFYNTIPEVKPDYVVASGIFNVKLDLANSNEWLDYIIQTLNSINMLAVKGFSFNALTIYSDKVYMKEYLYYADPLFLFNHCKQYFSKNVALLHDYNLFEFTLIVRK